MSAQEIKLQISNEVRELLESRGIRTEDVEKVIQNGEEKGEKLYREDRYLAKLRIGGATSEEGATFYVEYSIVGQETYLIHTAYSHKAKAEE